VVASAVLLVKMLGDYAGFSETFPEVAAEAVTSAVALLRFFNGRSAELVLGAGAIGAAALKRITAKHITLCCQSLSGVLALLPALRASLLLRLPPAQHGLLAELAVVTADLLMHDARLRGKLVTIFKELVSTCAGAMRALPWGNPNEAVQRPSPPMAELLAGVTTLHRILAATLRREQLVDVYSRILIMVNATLPGHYAALVTHLATTAAAALAAAQAATAGAPGPGAPQHTVATAVFDRAVATQRMGGDLRLLLQQLRTLSAEHGGGAATEPAPAPATDPQAEADAAAAAAASNEALESLERWVAREFPPGGGSPARGAAAAAAASPAEVLPAEALPAPSNALLAVGSDAPTPLTAGNEE
jgi:hypothetical protein